MTQLNHDASTQPAADASDAGSAQPARCGRLRRWTRRLVKLCCWCVALLIVAAVVTAVVINWRGAAARDAVLARAAKMGVERPRPLGLWGSLTNADVPESPDDGTRFLAGAFAVGLDFPDDLQDRNPFFGDTEWSRLSEAPSAEWLAAVEETLAANAAYTSLLDDATDAQTLGMPATDEAYDPLNLSMAHLSHFRAAARWQKMRAAYAAAQNQPAQAVQQLQRFIRIAEASSHQRYLIGLLVHCSLLNMAQFSVEGVNAQVELSPAELTQLSDQLAKLQQTTADRIEAALVSEAQHSMAVLLEPQRYVLREHPTRRAFFEDGDSRGIWASVMGPSDNLWNRIGYYGAPYFVTLTPGLYESALASEVGVMLDMLQQVRDTGVTPALAKTFRDAPTYLFDDDEDRAVTLTTWAGCGDPQRVRDSEKVALRTAMQALSRVALTRVALAVERYRVEHGRWPASLADAPGGDLPDPLTGEPFIYQITDAGVRLYGLGVNGGDDGGVWRADEGAREDQDDLHFQLFNPALRGRPPETPETPETPAPAAQASPEPDAAE